MSNSFKSALNSPDPSQLPTPSSRLLKAAGMKSKTKTKYYNAKNTFTSNFDNVDWNNYGKKLKNQHNKNRINKLVNRIRRGQLGKMKITEEELKSIFNRKNIRKDVKFAVVNKAFGDIGGQRVYNAIGPSLHASDFETFVIKKKGGIGTDPWLASYAPYIDYELLMRTKGQVVLGKGVIELGQGVAGRVVECISYSKCNRMYHNAVLKISKNNSEYRNEVNSLIRLNQVRGDPIAPKILANFVIHDVGFILLQNAQMVYPKARNIVQWGDMKPIERRLVLPEMKKTLKRLHATGLGHGNMHSYNVWVARFDVPKTKTNPLGKKYKVFFTDFGRAYEYGKRYNTTNKMWIYEGMAHRIPVKTSDKRKQLKLPIIMDDDIVMEMYNEYYNQNYKRLGGSMMENNIERYNLRRVKSS